MNTYMIGYKYFSRFGTFLSFFFKKKFFFFLAVYNLNQEKRKRDVQRIENMSLNDVNGLKNSISYSNLADAVRFEEVEVPIIEIPSNLLQKIRSVYTWRIIINYLLKWEV